MACYAPLRAVRRANGSVEVTRGGILAHELGEAFPVPCGRCVGCQLQYSQDWAIRMVHETLTAPASCFLTLTYRDEDLPDGGNLDKTHWQGFFKRLRYYCGPLRFFHCGEYGSKSGRPHYHALVFGQDFRGSRWRSRFYGKGKLGDELFRSEFLEDQVWKFGQVVIGEASFKSAAYVARYVTKRQPSNLFEGEGYKRSDFAKWKARLEGVRASRVPEYATMSRRPGLGYDFFQEHWRQIYAKDSVWIDGRLMQPPPYYDALLERRDPALLDAVRAKRLEKLREPDSDARRKARWKHRALVTAQMSKGGSM